MSSFALATMFTYIYYITAAESNFPTYCARWNNFAFIVVTKANVWAGNSKNKYDGMCYTFAFVAAMFVSLTDLVT